MNAFERLKEIANIFGLSGGESPTSWFDSSSPFCREAERLLRAGRAAEAEEMFARVLREPQYAAVVRRHHPRILLALATARLRQEKWDEARDAALQARAMLSDSRSKATLEFADCCRLLGQSARGQGRRDEALRYILEGIAAFELQRSPKPSDLIERRLEAASLLREMGRTEQAEHQAREAARIAAGHMAGQKEEGDALIELAQCLAAAGRFEEARQAGERAVEIHRAACGDYSSELAEDYEKLGGICQKQEDYQSAVAYLEKALGVRDRQVGGDTSQLGLLLVALADLYTILGRLAPALELLQQAVGKLGPARDANLADALEKLGAMYVRTGRYEDAADCYRRACDVWAVSPELYADRIAADVRALEEIEPWLPEPAPPRRPESAQPGITVRRDQSVPAQGWAVPWPPTQFSGVAAGPVPAGPPGAMQVGGPPLAGPASGALPAGAGIAQAAPPAAGSPQGLPGVPTGGGQGATGPGACGPAGAGADPATGQAPYWAPAPARGSAVPAAAWNGSVSGGESAGIPAQESGGALFGPVHAALQAMNHTLNARRDGQMLWGWEELDFEPLRR